MPEGSVGARFEMSLVPIVGEHTRYFDAGAIRIGIESRVLSNQTVTDAYAGDERAAAVFRELGIDSFDDEGPSLHVIDADTGREVLRFDMFDVQPHYHYIHSLDEHTAVVFDHYADDDMVSWTLQRLERSLPAMLRYAGSDELADRVDTAAVSSVVPLVRSYLGGVNENAEVSA